jgi:hypothetical protein
MTPTMAKKLEWVAINVLSSIWATPEKVWTMEWRRVKVCWVVDSRVCVSEGIGMPLASSGMPAPFIPMPIAPIPIPYGDMPIPIDEYGLIPYPPP